MIVRNGRVSRVLVLARISDARGVFRPTIPSLKQLAASRERHSTDPNVVQELTEPGDPAVRSSCSPYTFHKFSPPLTDGSRSFQRQLKQLRVLNDIVFLEPVLSPYSSSSFTAQLQL